MALKTRGSLYCQPQQQVVCLMAFPHVIKAESSREQSFPRVGQAPLSFSGPVRRGLWLDKKKKKKKEEKHNPAILLGFTVVHTCYHFKCTCILIRNILYSF